MDSKKLNYTTKELSSMFFLCVFKSCVKAPQLRWTLHNICRIWGSNFRHQKKILVSKTLLKSSSFSNVSHK